MSTDFAIVVLLKFSITYYNYECYISISDYNGTQKIPESMRIRGIFAPELQGGKTMESKEKVRCCDCCGAEIHGGEFAEFDGQILCPRCFDRETVLCSHCGERIWRDNNAGNSYTVLCQDCFNDYYTNCERCGCLIYEDYANYIDDTPYCDDCYESEKDHPIHDYSYKPDPIFYGSGNRFFGVELEIDDGGKDDDNAESLLEIGNVSGEKIYIKSSRIRCRSNFTTRKCCGRKS